MTARSNYREALQEAQRLGSAAIVTSDSSAALAYAPLYELPEIFQLPASQGQAAVILRRAAGAGASLVLLDMQQFADGAVLMGPEAYAGSAPGIIAQLCEPVWERDNLAGFFPVFCFEHNAYIRTALDLLEADPQHATRVGLYRLQDCLVALNAGVLAGE